MLLLLLAVEVEEEAIAFQGWLHQHSRGRLGRSTIALVRCTRYERSKHHCCCGRPLAVRGSNQKGPASSAALKQPMSHRHEAAAPTLGGQWLC